MKVLINQYLQGKDSLTLKGKGFGIRNVNRHIRLLYGERYGLSYHQWNYTPSPGGNNSTLTQASSYLAAIPKEL